MIIDDALGTNRATAAHVRKGFQFMSESLKLKIF